MHATYMAQIIGSCIQKNLLYSPLFLNWNIICSFIIITNKKYSYLFLFHVYLFCYPLYIIEIWIFSYFSSFHALMFILIFVEYVFCVFSFIENLFKVAKFLEHQQFINISRFLSCFSKLIHMIFVGKLLCTWHRTVGLRKSATGNKKK